MKRELTEDQKAKRDQRKAQFKALWKQVAAMPEHERIQLSNKYGFVTCEGHALSLCNSMLIALQNPSASVLGGFRQWIKHGRAVRKGEHGCMIWVPIGVAPDNQGSSSPSPLDNPGDAEAPETRFIIGTLFDISQTDEIETGQTSPVAQSAELQVA